MKQYKRPDDIYELLGISWYDFPFVKSPVLLSSEITHKQQTAWRCMKNSQEFEIRWSLDGKYCFSSTHLPFMWNGRTQWNLPKADKNRLVHWCHWWDVRFTPCLLERFHCTKNTLWNESKSLDSIVTHVEMLLLSPITSLILWRPYNVVLTSCNGYEVITDIKITRNVFGSRTSS